MIAHRGPTLLRIALSGLVGGTRSNPWQVSWARVVFALENERVLLLADPRNFVKYICNYEIIITE